MKYTVTFDDGKTCVSGELDRPERLPQCGDVYEVVQNVVTLAGHTHRRKDRMEVLERTGFAPHHRKSSLGNLLIRTKFGTSVWTCFEVCVAEGYFKLIEERR